jgi:hypothetical protein
VADRTPRQLFEAWVDALTRWDLDALQRLMHPDFVEEYPQSGERLRGPGAIRAMLERYPGGLERRAQETYAEFLDDEERWVLTPAYTVLPLAASGRYTTLTRTRYPDGSLWHIVSFFTVRDGLMARRTTYFAQEFEPPAWRADLVERFDP